MTATEAQPLREQIALFLQDRLETKLASLKEAEPDLEKKRDSLRERFQRENWIADAAQRVGQLQVVTHVAKATHPDTKGASLYIPPPSMPAHSLVGSHLLGETFDTDVVGNAAALDVFKFLKIEYEGRTVLARALAGESALAHAFSDDSDLGMEWVRSFAGITEPRGQVTSDPRSKQIYWLVGDDPADDAEFHLLSPLYSTILAHRAYRTITGDRFSDAATEARKAYRAGKYSDYEYRDYPGLATQKLGGSNKQNISQLNIERGGNNYLLASLPPQWTSRDSKPVLHVESAFLVFDKRPEVRRLVNRLRRFLKADPAANKETRDRRDADVAALIDELIRFTAQLNSLDPGWTAGDACQLSRAQSLWLDPGRAEIDTEFAEDRERGEWVAEVRERFASWLNGRLLKSIPVGDAEHREWEAQLKLETDALEEVLTHV